jgi:multiple sugar transport system permease protein
MRSEEKMGGLLSHNEWARRDIRWLFGSAQALLFVLLILIGLGPVVWLAKGAITPTIDTLRNPLALFPHGAAWSNLTEAWSHVNVGRYFWNTVVLAFGSWLCQIVVATTGAFVLSVLRPAWGRFV